LIYNFDDSCIVAIATIPGIQNCCDITIYLI
jgi:hypothetical protein